MKTCLRCESETSEESKIGEIVPADYVVAKNTGYDKRTVKAYVCEKHLRELTIGEINSAKKLHVNATDINIIIRDKRK